MGFLFFYSVFVYRKAGVQCAVAQACTAARPTWLLLHPSLSKVPEASARGLVHLRLTLLLHLRKPSMHLGWPLWVITFAVCCQDPRFLPHIAVHALTLWSCSIIRQYVLPFGKGLTKKKHNATMGHKWDILFRVFRVQTSINTTKSSCAGS